MLTQCPDVAALRVFRSFLSLPYCPTFCRVCTGGSHHPLFPSVGLASPHGVLPGSSPQKDTSCRSKPWSGRQAEPRQRCFLSAVVCPSHRQADPSPPRCREKSVPGILAQVSACHLHPQLSPPSPLSHGQGASTRSIAQPASGSPCPAKNPNTHRALPFSTHFKTQLQRSWEEPKTFSTLFSTRNREQIC